MSFIKVNKQYYVSMVRKDLPNLSLVLANVNSQWLNKMFPSGYGYRSSSKKRFESMLASGDDIALLSSWVEYYAVLASLEDKSEMVFIRINLNNLKTLHPSPDDDMIAIATNEDIKANSNIEYFTKEQAEALGTILPMWDGDKIALEKEFNVTL
jgi:hypothetical protein